MLWRWGRRATTDVAAIPNREDERAMSDEDPFKRRDTRPFLGKTDRRESLRADIECRVVFEGGAEVELTGNVSLTGCMFEPGAIPDAPKQGTPGEIELAIDRRRTLKLPFTVAPPPGLRPGLFLRFPELDFDTERSLARLLDTTNFDETSVKPA